MYLQFFFTCLIEGELCSPVYHTADTVQFLPTHAAMSLAFRNVACVRLCFPTHSSMTPYIDKVTDWQSVCISGYIFCVPLLVVAGASSFALKTSPALWTAVLWVTAIIKKNTHAFQMKCNESIKVSLTSHSCNKTHKTMLYCRRVPGHLAYAATIIIAWPAVWNPLLSVIISNSCAVSALRFSKCAMWDWSLFPLLTSTLLYCICRMQRSDIVQHFVHKKPGQKLL